MSKLTGFFLIGAAAGLAALAFQMTRRGASCPVRIPMRPRRYAGRVNRSNLLLGRTKGNSKLETARHAT